MHLARDLGDLFFYNFRQRLELMNLRFIKCRLFSLLNVFKIMKMEGLMYIFKKSH